MQNRSMSKIHYASIMFTDAFWDEFLQLPRSICKKAIQTFKILESDPISAQGKAKKLRGCKDDKYRILLGKYCLIYSFEHGQVRIFSIRKQNGQTYRSL